ncbi:hypothetical protein GOBAR_DD01506 [Gossypium barbadense]|nr:hypothetical protein GOBAR_DD01506 [Gossypium barbadense]
MGVNTNKKNEIFMFGKMISPVAQQLRANTTRYKQRGKPPNETLGIQEQQSVHLQLAMERLICDLKRNLDKDVMVSNPQVVEEGMIVDDIDGVEGSELWHFLNYLAGSVEGPWMLSIDFNSILDGGERQGGASISRVGCKWFREFLFDNALQDFGANGTSLHGVGECSMRNFRGLKSDYRLILISPKPSVSKGLRLFRCLASWMSYVDFGNIVSSSWNNELAVGDNLERFQESVKEWNKQVYGNIFVRKRKLISELERVQKVLEHVVQFFKEVYTMDYLISSVFACRGKFPRFSYETMALISMVSDEEVCRAVFSMAPLKAPGVDGFQET